MKKFLAFVPICLFLVSLTFFSPQALANTASDLSNSSSSVLPAEDFSLTTPIPTVGYTVVQQGPQEQSSGEDVSPSTNVLGQQTVKAPFALNNYFSVLSRVSFFVVLIILAAILVEVLVVSGKLRKKPQIFNTSVVAVRSTPVANSLIRPLSQSTVVPNAVQGSSGVNVLASTPSSSVSAAQTASGQAKSSVLPATSVSTPLASLPPLPKKKIDKKTIGLIIIVLFLLLSVPLALIVVKQNQEVRKQASETICCRVEARNLCAGDGGFRSWDMTVGSFATEAECDNYIANNTYTYSCNCCATCGADNPDRSQTCGNDTACPGTFKQRCYSSGDDLRKVIVNPEACVGPTMTPTPTVVVNTPTPTIPLNTPTPTITGQPTPTPTIPLNTPTPTITGQPTPTPTPTLIPGCGQRQCTTNADCPADFPYCFDRPSDNIAIKVCVINTSWYDGCETWSCAEKRCTVGSAPNGCPSSYPVCASTAGKGEVCVINASWNDGCTSPIAQATPTIAVPPIPNAAFELPAILSVVGGIILLVLGVLL